MYIAEITYRNRNDFVFVAVCRFCQKKSTWGDGYADGYYQMRVFPARYCPHCGVNELGERRCPTEGKQKEDNMYDDSTVILVTLVAAVAALAGVLVGGALALLPLWLETRDFPPRGR